jgi:molybdate transport system regulatory protein
VNGSEPGCDGDHRSRGNGDRRPRRRRRLSEAVKPKVKVWVAFSDDLKFGEGRARLLEIIDQRGSLQQAAKHFEMSYRYAWGYLRELERAAGFKFVHRVRGGGPRAGMRLTVEARRFIADYRRFSVSLTHATERCFAQAFGKNGSGMDAGTRPAAPRRGSHAR